MWRLAWRNIWRKRGRSLMTIGAVGGVVFMTMLYFGLVGSMENGIYERLTQTVGHLQVHVKDYRDIRDFSDALIRESRQLEQSLSDVNVNGTLDFVSALEVPGLLEGKGRSRGVMLIGNEQAQASRERFIRRNLLEGSFPEPDDLESIALGKALAEALKVNLGDTVYMYAPGTEGYGAAAYTVTGLLKLGETGMEARVGYISLAAAQELAAPEAVGRLELHMAAYHQLADDKNLTAIKEALEPAIPDHLILETWREVDPSLAAYLGFIAPATTIFTAIFFILAGLLVMNTVYLGLIERVREFGVMMAVGAARRKLMGMVFAESLLLCFTGALAGALLGLVAIAFMSQGFSLPATESMLELYESLGIPRILYGSISLRQILTTVIFTFSIGILAALLPALTAAKLEPVEAMRFTA